MGLAASQCRLLLLTARLSDTEFRAQMISARRMALAMQTQQIANDYARKLNNKTLRHVYALDANQNNTTIKEPLTYYTLTGNNSALGGGLFRVVTPDGRIAVPELKNIPGVFVSKNSDNKQQYNYVTKDLLLGFAKECAGNNDTVSEYIKDEMTDEDYNALYDIIMSDKDAYDAFSEYIVANQTPIVFEENTEGSLTIYGQEYVVIPQLANTEIFQNALQTGAIYVEQYQRNFTENKGCWASYDIIDSPFVEEVLDTSDDQAAQAEYTSKSALIQAQDKFLEMELKQVETQHQAAQTEYDSVKKIIDKNIERSFKTFG